MEIYLLRHGKAEERHPNSDAKRRLTESGKTELTKIASGIVSLGIRPDIIISSPLVRSKETAEIISEHISKYKSMPKVTIWQDLKPESNIYQTHKKLIRMTPDSHVMLVGHEPHLSLLISSIICCTQMYDNYNSTNIHSHNYTNTHQENTCDVASINLKKGGLAIIRANAKHSTMCGSLRSLMIPKQLKLCGHIKEK